MQVDACTNMEKLWVIILESVSDNHGIIRSEIKTDKNSEQIQFIDV